MKPELVWQEPPPNRRNAKWAEALRPLMAQPGRWARIMTVPSRRLASHYASAINHNARYRNKPASRIVIPPGRWEAVTRRLYEGEEQGWFGLFVRYLGPEEETK